MTAGSIYDFLRPFVVLAADAAEGLSTSIADMYGRNHNTKHALSRCRRTDPQTPNTSSDGVQLSSHPGGCLRRTHDNICKYADHVVAGLNSYMKTKRGIETMTASAIRRFLDDEFGFVGWSTEVGNEWMMHLDKFSELKPGMVRRGGLPHHRPRAAAREAQAIVPACGFTCCALLCTQQVLRKELTSFVKYGNQFEPVVDGTW